VEKYCRAEQATDDNMVHAYCMLDNEGYKHTLRLCNTHCFSTPTMVVRVSMLSYIYIACLVLGLQTANTYLTQKSLLNNLTIQTRSPPLDTRRRWYPVFGTGTMSGKILAFNHSPFQQLLYRISSRIKECAA